MQSVLTIVAEIVIVITLYSFPSSSRENMHEQDGVQEVERVEGVYLVEGGTKLGRSRVDVRHQ